MEYRPDVCMEEGCPVCGDKVSGYHYGLLTCESCKGFFKRTVQNNKKYICAEYQECWIDKSQRKRCPFCRFQKCLHVGMRLEAVRADRMRGGRNKFGPMYKRDRALKQQRHLALTEATGGLSCSPPLVSSALHRDLAFTGGLLPGITLPTAQSDCISYQYSLHPNSSTPAPTHYQCTSFSDWAIKLERSNNCGASSEGSVVGVPPLVQEFLRCDPDELQLQRKVSAHLMEHQTGWEDHDNPITFSLMCHMADQTLISIVEWARSSIFFKQLKVGDQMKLLQSCWSDLLLLDLISRQVLYGREGRLLLVTGQEIELADIASHVGPTLASLIQRGQELVGKLDIIKVDRQEFACIKFLILFNPDVKELDGHQLIESVQEQVEGALLEYTLVTSSHLLGRFAGLLLCVSELRVLSSLAEEYLCYKHLSAEVPCNSLLIEMLYAKCNWD